MSWLNIISFPATQFAIEMGFKEEDLHSNESVKMFEDWKKNNCQPNYRIVGNYIYIPRAPDKSGYNGIGKLFSLFLIQNICCGYSKEPSQ